MSDRNRDVYQGNGNRGGQGSGRDLYQWDGSGGGNGGGQGAGRDLYQWDGSGGGNGSGQGGGRDLYQWDGGDGRQPSPPQRNDGGAGQRMRDDAYQPPAQHHRPRRTDYYPQQGGCYPQGGGRPQEVRTPGRNGGDNVMIVYGDVYISQGGNDSGCGCRRRQDGRDEYYGRGYDYSQYYRQQYQQYQQYYNYAYRQPQYEPCQPYYEYGYRQYQPQPNYYNRSGGAYFHYEGGAGYQGQARFRVSVGF